MVTCVFLYMLLVLHNDRQSANIACYVGRALHLIVGKVGKV
jgi:hypothetical protein